jgi:hypothetical protein
MAVKHFTLVVVVLLLTMGAVAQDAGGSQAPPGCNNSAQACDNGSGAILVPTPPGVSIGQPGECSGCVQVTPLPVNPSASSGPSWNLGMDAGPGLFGMGSQLPGGGVLGNLAVAYHIGIPVIAQTVAKSVGQGLIQGLGALGQMLPQNVPCAIACAIGGPNGGTAVDRGPRWGTPPWRSNVGEAMAKYDTIVDAPIKNGSYYGPFGGQNGNHFIPELYDLSKGSGALSGHAGDALVEWTTRGNGQTIQQIIRSKPALAKYFIEKAERTQNWGKWAMGIEIPMKPVNGVEPGLRFPNYLLPPD